MQTRPAPASKIKVVQRFETSDMRVWETEEEARRHEVFLNVKHVVPQQIHRGLAAVHHNLAYDVIKALAAQYDFVPRTQGVTVTVTNEAGKSMQLHAEVADHLHSLQRRGGYAP